MILKVISNKLPVADVYMYMKTMKVSLLLLLLICASQFAAAFEIDPVVRAKNKAVVDQLLRENQDKYQGSRDMLVLPGLLADRKTKQITMQAESTGLTEGSPVEFFLIGETSGHAYESLAVSFAKPGDVQKALEFIGMRTGRPVDGRKCAFWPKGERVIITLSSPDSDKSLKPTRMETLVLDSRTKKSLPDCGLVFTGSLRLETPDSMGRTGLAVDIREPNSIASSYNAAETVMDVPFSWSQKSVYGNLLVNPAHILKPGGLLTIVLEPERRDGTKRVMDLKLAISVKTGAVARKLNDLEFHLIDQNDVELNTTFELNAALKLVDSINDRNQDPFVSVLLGDAVTVGAAAEVCGILSKIDTEKGIRIEPPTGGQLYYRAFVPNEQQRNRADRFAQPWELNLSFTNSNLQAVLSRIDQVWKDDKTEPDLKTTDFTVNTPQELQKILKDKGPGVPVIFVFTDPILTCGQLMSFVGPVQEAYPMIHVYVK